MTRAGTSPVIKREERSAGLVGMGAAALDIASRGMTRTMDTSPVMRKETRDACETGKVHPVRAVSKTGSARGALHTACPRTATSWVITSKSWKHVIHCSVFSFKNSCFSIYIASHH